jgi:tRNA G26 N,N-dimethylase Trm1
LDCHASAAHYLDSAFRNLPNGGILAITTTDDALHSNAEIALKNYGGFVTRTFYSKELTVRLIVAAMARFVQSAEGPLIEAFIYIVCLVSSW